MRSPWECTACASISGLSVVSHASLPVRFRHSDEDERGVCVSQTLNIL